MESKDQPPRHHPFVCGLDYEGEPPLCEACLALYLKFGQQWRLIVEGKPLPKASPFKMSQTQKGK